jgi:hypothetical protein
LRGCRPAAARRGPFRHERVYGRAGGGPHEVHALGSAGRPPAGSPYGLRTDAVVLRAFLRNFNLLETPDSLLANGDVMRRVLAAWRERDQRAPAEPLGPGRAEMVRVLEQAA